MAMTDKPISTLQDLARLRTAPELSNPARLALREELSQAMATASWFTVGVMAPSADAALAALRRLEQQQGWTAMELMESPQDEGPVFLKANQTGGSIRIRIEHGLGEGILISGHGEDASQPATTWGPLPLDLF